jgi:hypothetical protein
MEPYLKKGAPIVCPVCFKAALRLARDVYENELIVASQVEIIIQYGPDGPLKTQHRAPTNGDPISCLCCNARFGSIERVNVRRGIYK